MIVKKKEVFYEVLHKNIVRFFAKTINFLYKKLGRDIYSIVKQKKD